eukprot:Opistho-2@62079
MADEEQLTGKGTLTKWKQMEAAALMKSVDSMKLDGIPAWKKDLLDKKKGTGVPGAPAEHNDASEPEWVKALKERQKRPAKPSESNRAAAASSKFNTVERSNISLLGSVTIPSEPPLIKKPEPEPEVDQSMDACVPGYQPPPQKSDEEIAETRAAKKRKVVSFRDATLEIPFIFYDAEYLSEEEEDELSVLRGPRYNFEVPDAPGAAAPTQEETKPMDVTNLEDELAALLW